MNGRPGSRRAAVMVALLFALLFSAPVDPVQAKSGLGSIPGHAYSAPYEDVRIKR